MILHNSYEATRYTRRGLLSLTFVRANGLRDFQTFVTDSYIAMHWKTWQAIEKKAEAEIERLSSMVTTVSYGGEAYTLSDMHHVLDDVRAWMRRRPVDRVKRQSGWTVEE